jgi:hypothetical protein
MRVFSRVWFAAMGLGLVGAACSSSSSPAPKPDASTTRDAARDEVGATSTAEGTATTTSQGFSSPVPDAEPEMHNDAGGGLACTTADQCPVGDVCCASVGGLIKKSVCTAKADCTGGAEACGTFGGGPCMTGTCERYTCSISTIGAKETVYACEQPILEDGMCILQADAGPLDGGEGSGSGSSAS